MANFKVINQPTYVGIGEIETRMHPGNVLVYMMKDRQPKGLTFLKYPTINDAGIQIENNQIAERIM